MSIRVFNAQESLTESIFYKGIFLAGSIEMGEAINWQQNAINLIEERLKLKGQQYTTTYSSASSGMVIQTGTTGTAGTGGSGKTTPTVTGPIYRSRYGQDYCVFNPRKGVWKETDQKMSDDIFYRQVRWELEAMEKAETILMNFVPGTRSPISLFELGLHSKFNSSPTQPFRNTKLVVVCPDGFWRKGNVDIICEFYRIPQFQTIEEAIFYILS